MRTNKGFSLMEGVIIVAVVAIVGLLAWKGYDAWQAGQSSKTADQSSKTDSLPTVKQKSDLSTAEKAVQDVNPDSLDTSTIDQTLN